MRIVETHTGKIYVDKNKQLEFLTVGDYGKENNIKAKYIKPYIQTTVSHDFSDKLKNLLNRHYDPTKPNVAW